MNVTLLPVESDVEFAALYHFFIAYFYDLSQYDDNLVLNRYGLPCWKPFLEERPGDNPTTPLECARFNWWIRDRCLLYLICVDESPAGFGIVLTEQKYLVEEVDYELMDFYISPKYREQGVGRTAASMIFDRFQGRWQVFQLERNLRAITFWHKVIGTYTNGLFTILDSGAQQRFDNTLPDVTSVSDV